MRHIDGNKLLNNLKSHMSDYEINYLKKDLDGDENRRRRSMYSTILIDAHCKHLLLDSLFEIMNKSSTDSIEFKVLKDLFLKYNKEAEVFIRDIMREIE